MNRRRRKRIIQFISTFLICIGFGLVIYAWSIGKKEVVENADASEEVLSFAVYGDVNTETIVKQAVQSFQQLNNCKVDVYCYGTKEEEESQVLGQVAGGKGFDIFYASPEILEEMAGVGEVVILDDILEGRQAQGEAFYPVALEEGKIGTHQYALPIGVQPYMLYYNKDILEQMEMQNPQELFDQKQWTAENACSYFEELTEKSQKAALKLQNSVLNIELIIGTCGGSWHLDGQTLKMDKKAEKALENWKQLRGNHVIDLLSADKYEEYKNSFQNGEEAFVLGDLSMTRLLYETDFSWDIVPFPSENGDFSNSIFTIPMIAAGVGDHQQLSCEFINYYISALGQKLRLESGECLMPSLSMVFYTSMGDVAFPEHSNYYFFAIENGYSSENVNMNESEKQQMLQWFRSEENQ